MEAKQDRFRGMPCAFLRVMSAEDFRHVPADHLLLDHPEELARLVVDFVAAEPLVHGGHGAAQLFAGSCSMMSMTMSEIFTGCPRSVPGSESWLG